MSQKRYGIIKAGQQGLERRKLKQVSQFQNSNIFFIDNKRPFFVGTAIKSNQNVVKSLPFPGNSGQQIQTVPGFGNVLVGSKNSTVDPNTNRGKTAAARNRRMHSLGFRKPGENNTNGQANDPNFIRGIRVVGENGELQIETSLDFRKQQENKIDTPSN